jgi:hypothetical protein
VAFSLSGDEDERFSVVSALPEYRTVLRYHAGRADELTLQIGLGEHAHLGRITQEIAA